MRSRSSRPAGSLAASCLRSGSSPVETKVLGYARIPLAQWFVLAGVIPLGFLLYRRNI